MTPDLHQLTAQQLRERLESWLIQWAPGLQDDPGLVPLLAEVERRCVLAEEAEKKHREADAMLRDAWAHFVSASHIVSKLTDALIAAAEQLRGHQTGSADWLAATDKLYSATIALRAVRTVEGEQR